MMKNEKKTSKKIFAILLCLVAVTFILLLVIYTKSPTKETYALSSNDRGWFDLELPSEFDLHGYNYLTSSSTLQFHSKYFDFGDGQKTAFCTDPNLNISSGTWANPEQTEPAYSYIIYAGMTHREWAGGYTIGREKDDLDKRYFLVQLAMWWYGTCGKQPTCGKIGTNLNFKAFNLDYDDYTKSYYSYGGTTTGAGSIPAMMAELIAGASANWGGTYEDFTSQASTTINTSGDKLIYNASSGYYESGPITVTVTPTPAEIVSKNNYKLYLTGNYPSGTIIVDENGNAATEFSTGSTYIIKVPANAMNINNTSVNVSIKATGTMEYYRAYSYTKTDGSDEQHLTVSWPEEIITEDTKSFSATSNYVKISKVDITGTTELAGAQLEVYKGTCNNASELVESWESETQPHYIKLDEGNYCLIETKPPAGYVISSEKIDFTITDGGDTPTVLMKNSLTELVISKQDATTGKELPGAELILTDSNGTVKDQWVSTNEKHKVYGLTPGTYTLTEKIAPSGYLLNTSSVKITVNENGITEAAIMTNELNELKISKQDATTGKELPGAHLVLKDSKGTKIKEWDSTNTPYIIKGIAPGTYTLTEVIAPKGYKLKKETVKITVKEDGTVDPVVMKNEKTELEISKQDATTGKELPGAHLVLKDANDKVIDEWDSTDTPHKIKGLANGEYTLTETIAPEGYDLNKETVKFTMKDDGTVTKVIMKNTPTKVPEEVPPEQVPTGDIPIIMVVILAILSIGFVIYYHYNQKNKMSN